MADVYVPIDTNKRLGAEARQLIDSTRFVLDRAEKLKDIMVNMTDGVAFGTIETQFGLPSGAGSAFKVAVENLHAALDVANVKALLNRAG